MDRTTHNFELGLIDFMDEANFQQFMGIIRGEAEDPTTHFCVNWDCDHVVQGCPQFLPMVPENIPDLRDLYEFHAIPQNVSTQDQAQPSNEKPLTLPVCNPTKPKAKKGDRARTLISERKRRSSMKEKLYALRSLVPYITKMDKASIIGDAIRYVQELQMKTRKLKAEIADLESPVNLSPAGGVASFQDTYRLRPKITYIIPPPIKNIFQIEMFEVDYREFYIKIVCNKSPGIAEFLYKALDSVGLNVQSSNLATSDDQNYLFTFTLNVAREFAMDITLSDLKLWIASAFCNQGFQFSTMP